VNRIGNIIRGAMPLGTLAFSLFLGRYAITHHDQGLLAVYVIAASFGFTFLVGWLFFIRPQSK
jgi:hypothetical protein